eukprot:TRINITY_DN25736_c0_g1_i1.p1 TRINITY_DN25736_c0_g1~~TRINITY_DN25736_c0_g1_i1.p1  ORF type:complete len:185 (+),score=13.59 TRINITY_DN25736_c0_g1_i1:84-557(+)
MISPASSLFSSKSSVEYESEVGPKELASEKISTIANLNEASTDELQGCMHYFSFWGKSASVSLLTHLGQSPSLPDTSGNVALHWAVRGNKPSTIRTLIGLGADSIQNYSAQTPIGLAKHLGYSSSVKAFTDAVPAPASRPSINSLYKKKNTGSAAQL